MSGPGSFGGIARTDVALIRAKHHVQHPVQSVLHAPMTTDGPRELLRLRPQAAQVVTAFPAHVRVVNTKTYQNHKIGGVRQLCVFIIILIIIFLLLPGLRLQAKKRILTKVLGDWSG